MILAKTYKKMTHLYPKNQKIQDTHLLLALEVSTLKKTIKSTRLKDFLYQIKSIFMKKLKIF